MACPCNVTIRSTSLEIVGTAPNQTLQINIPARNFNELDRFNLIICQTIPPAALLGSFPVVIMPNGEEAPTTSVNRVANTLRADQIRCRKKYTVYYGSDPEHFYFRDHVPQTAIIGGLPVEAPPVS